MSSLKLSEIVGRAGLSLSTVQYVLKHPEYRLEMPEAGSQGVHRKFDYDQAFRLALCATLVTCGITLEEAAYIVRYCDASARSVARRPHCLALPFGSGAAWSLRIRDCNYLRLANGKTKHLPPEGWFSIRDRKTMKQIFPSLFHIEVNLSLLQQVLEQRPTT